jgi:hypothetical protein
MIGCPPGILARCLVGVIAPTIGAPFRLLVYVGDRLLEGSRVDPE